MSDSTEQNDTETSSKPGEPGSLRKYALSNNRDADGTETRVDPTRSRVCVLVEITAESTAGAGMRADEAVTIIAEQLQASADAVVASFNRSQSFTPHGVQVSVSSTRAMGCADDENERIDITDEGRAALARVRR